MKLKRFSIFRTLRLATLVGVIAGLALSQTAAGSQTASGGAVLRTADNHRLGNEEFPFRVKTAPGLAVNPANPNNVVAVMMDLGFEECQYAASDDGGRTWDGPKNLVAPAGFYQEGEFPCTVLHHGANSVDSGVAFGNHGVYTTWATDAKDAFSRNQSVLVSRSTDGGHNFPPGTVALAGGTTAGSPNPGPNYWYPKLVVIPGGGTDGADKLVVSADNNQLNETTHAVNGNVVVTISNDNGATWSAPIQVNRPVDTRETVDDGTGTQVPNPAYEPFGGTESTHPVRLGNDLYIAWRTTTKQVRNPTTGVSSPISSQSPDFPKGLVRIAKSSDGGLSWAQSDVVAVEGYVFTGPAGIPPYNAATVRFNGSSFPALAAGNGEVYLTWAQHSGWYDNSGTLVAQDHFQIQNSAVWFAKTANPTGPPSWSAPKQINRSPTVRSQQFSPMKGETPATANQTTTINALVNGTTVNDPIENHQGDTQTRHPNMTVAPNGRIDLVWHDRRHAYRGCSQTHVACDEMRLGDTYYSYSTDGGATWSPNRRITDRSVNNDVGYDYKFSTYWDYGPVSAPIGNDKVLFAWMDSREGNYDTDAQDIYVATLNHHDLGNPVVRSLGSGQAGDLSVALSKAANPGGSEGRLAGTFSSQNATYVTIAKAGDQAGILAGGVLARANGGPLLLSATAGLGRSVKDEVARMGPVGAFVVGDTRTLSRQVETDLANLGIPSARITRITGTGATLAANVAAAMDRRTTTAKTAGLPAFDAAVVALASGPEAVAASTLAVNRRLPVLYVDRRSVPADTAAALSSLKINKTLVIGGPNVIAASVLASLPNPTRLGGADQYETSRAVLQAAVNDWRLPRNTVFVANGSNPQHGALLGTASGRIGGLLLLTRNGTADEAKAVLDGLGLTGEVDRILTSTLTE